MRFFARFCCGLERICENFHKRRPASGVLGFSPAPYGAPSCEKKVAICSADRITDRRRS